MARITKRLVDASEPRDKRYIVFDDEVRGFGLRVYPSGDKSYIFEYRPPNGGRSASKKRVLIGKVGDFTPDQARKEADRHRTTVKTGGDPQEAKNEWRRAMTVNDLADKFLTHIAEDRSETTHAGYEQVLRTHLRSKHGTKKAMELSHADMARLHRDMRETPAQANRLLRVVSSMYNWGAKKAQGYVPAGANPTTDIERYTELAREVELTDDQLARLGDSLRLAETVGIPWVIDPKKQNKHLRKDVEKRVTLIDRYAATAIRLLIFTGARVREILNLRWADIDWDKAEATIFKHKTARTKGKKPLPLNEIALDILHTLDEQEKELEKLQGWRSEYVVAGADPSKPRADLQRPWDAVRTHAGLPDLRRHDMRHNFAGFGVGEDMGLPVIAKLLGHSSVQSTERYAHLRRGPHREATSIIAKKLAAALGEAAATADGRPIADDAEI